MDNFRRVVGQFESDYQTSGFAFVKGAKYAAALTQELGEIVAQVSSMLTPAQIKKCEAIFAKNKEIVDEQL